MKGSLRCTLYSRPAAPCPPPAPAAPASCCSLLDPCLDSPLSKMTRRWVHSQRYIYICPMSTLIRAGSQQPQHAMQPVRPVEAPANTATCVCNCLLYVCCLATHAPRQVGSQLAECALFVLAGSSGHSGTSITLKAGPCAGVAQQVPTAARPSALRPAGCAAHWSASSGRLCSASCRHSHCLLQSLAPCAAAGAGLAWGAPAGTPAGRPSGAA